jgi:hypothetical protein
MIVDKQRAEETLQAMSEPGERWSRFFNCYWVSNRGRVISFRRGFPESPSVFDPGWGFPSVRVADRTIGIHRLVAKAFCHNPNPKTHVQVFHLDRDKNNNNDTNLRWVTPKQAMRYRKHEKGVSQ